MKVGSISDLEVANDTQPEDQFSEDSQSESDRIFNHHNARLQLGFLLMDIVDAIKEGDGFRLVNCYKFVLLFAYKFKHTKYAYARLLFFVLIRAVRSTTTTTNNNKFYWKLENN